MTLRLYSHPISPCCQKVKFLLLEKNINFEEVFIDLGAKQNLSNTYLKINPSGTVPTLQDNKKYIFESNIICEYLEEKFSVIKDDLIKEKAITKQYEEEILGTKNIISLNENEINKLKNALEEKILKPIKLPTES